MQYPLVLIRQPRFSGETCFYGMAMQQDIGAQLNARDGASRSKAALKMAPRGLSLLPGSHWVLLETSTRLTFLSSFSSLDKSTLK